MLSIELGYLVPANSPIGKAEDIDKPGVKIGVTKGSATERTLPAKFRSASIVPAESVKVAIAMFDRGEIDGDGEVGPIGGIEHKLQGAKRDGATVFLVPAANCDAAKSSPPADLQLVKVESLDGAVQALADVREGRPAPSC